MATETYVATPEEWGRLDTNIYPSARHEFRRRINVKETAKHEPQCEFSFEDMYGEYTLDECFAEHDAIVEGLRERYPNSYIAYVPFSDDKEAK